MTEETGIMYDLSISLTRISLVFPYRVTLPRIESFKVIEWCRAEMGRDGCPSPSAGVVFADCNWTYIKQEFFFKHASTAVEFKLRFG